MIKTNNADSAGRNNLSGVLDSPCLGSFPARIPPQTPPVGGTEAEAGNNFGLVLSGFHQFML